MQYNSLDIIKESNGIIVIVDKSPQHNLRSKPLFYSLGLSHVTYPMSWRSINKRQQADFIEEFVRSTRIEKMPGSLVVFTTQQWETRYSFNSISSMIDNALFENTKLVVVCDSDRYQTFGSHRPLIEQDFVKNPLLSFDDIYYDYTVVYDEFSYPLRDSKNVFYQKCASLLIDFNGVRCHSLKLLHKNIVESPFNPLWDFYSNLFMTYEGIQIPVEEKSSGLIQYLKKRVEMSDRDLHVFIHTLRGKAEKLLNPKLRDENTLFSSGLHKSEITKIIAVKKEFGLST